MLKLFPFIILLMIFASCEKEEKVVYIEFGNGQGIQPNDQLLLANGKRVGKVLKAGFNDNYTVIIAVQLSDSINFAADTRFQIGNKSLYEKAIHVTFGKSKTDLKSGDTIRGID